MTPGLFSSIPTSIGHEAVYPQLTRSLPADMVVGAAAVNAPSGPAELENMWISGFLDYDGVGPKGESRGLLAKQLGQYEVRFGVRRAAAVSRKTTPGMIASAEKKLGGGGGGVGDGVAGGDAPKSFLSGAEIQRLRELEARLRIKTGEKPTANLASTPYAKENVVLRRMLELRGETGGRKLQRLFRAPPKLMVSTSMDNLIWLERLETQAAILVQRMFRKYLRNKFWRKYISPSSNSYI